jgi:alanyl-tRNA synthetase
MTDRLYYHDPYLKEFDAIVQRTERREDRLVITLDRSAFYPTSGGQPFDVGSLGPYTVVDVVDEEDGSVAHVLDGQTSSLAPGAPEPEPGTSLHGTIDWPRRFDHMQQHTGQHVLSAAFDRLFRIRTVSFHMGAVASTIDLAREASTAEIAAAETEANRIVWEDRPVSIRYASAEEAARMPLRKESVRSGTLRLVDVDGFDLSACGGTHVARTGGIGVIAVASWERFKGGQRLEFLCGGRALDRWRILRDAVSAGVQQLSVQPAELAAAIERLQSEAKEQKRSAIVLQGELARYRAVELAASAEAIRLTPGTTCRLVARALDADANGLKAMATAIVAAPGHLVALVSESKPALVVIARSADVDVSAQKALADLVAKFGGRGGGKPDFAQGGGFVATTDEIIAALRASL